MQQHLVSPEYFHSTSDSLSAISNKKTLNRKNQLRVLVLHTTQSGQLGTQPKALFLLQQRFPAYGDKHLLLSTELLAAIFPTQDQYFGKVLPRPFTQASRSD